MRHDTCQHVNMSLLKLKNRQIFPSGIFTPERLWTIHHHILTIKPLKDRTETHYIIQSNRARSSRCTCCYCSLTRLPLLPVWLHPLLWGEFSRGFQDLSGVCAGDFQERHKDKIQKSLSLKQLSLKQRPFLFFVPLKLGSVVTRKYMQELPLCLSLS